MSIAVKIKLWKIVVSLVPGLMFSGMAAPAPNAIQWGVNIHDGGSNPQNLADKLAERNIKCVRMDLWGTDSNYLTKFKNAVTILNAKSIKTEAVVFTIFSNGQSRSQDYGANLTEVEQTAYNATKPQIDSTKNLMLDYEMQNEISLYPNIQVSGSSGQNAADFNTPAGRLQAAVLKGMSQAINDVRNSSGRPLRIILGTTGRSFGLLTYMQQQGVLFDVVGYHIYPWETNAPLDQDTWYGTGGPLGQLATFNKPIHINEFNSGEIYSGDGNPGRPTAQYENQPGGTVTEAGFRSMNKHLKEIVNQTVANVEAVHIYEIWDEPSKAIPENRFGLYYDTGLQNPKTSLFLETCFAGGTLSQAEQDSLTKRGFGPCSSTGVTKGKNFGIKPENKGDFIQARFPLVGRSFTLYYQSKSNGVLDLCSLSGNIFRRFSARAGMGTVVWDGSNYTGQPVPSGLYVLRMQIGDEVKYIRLVYTR